MSDEDRKDRSVLAGMSRKATDEDRFWANVVMVENCWEWVGRRGDDGYGDFRFRGRNYAAHRAAYEMFVGPVPEGLFLDHLCRNRGCVNPHHLEPTTKRINNLRGTGFSARNAAKTHCPKGHPLDGVATSRLPGSSGVRRFCRTCKAAHGKAQRLRRTERARIARLREVLS